MATYGTLTTGAAFKPRVLAQGQQTCPTLGNITTARCVLFQWPQLRAAYDPNRGNQPSEAWHRSLLDSKRDGSGLLYKRNRMYDPQTGRFTQEDPIGLAGGLNLHGFAGSNPVNANDPFGLIVSYRSEQERHQVEEAANRSPTLKLQLMRLDRDSSVVVTFEIAPVGGLSPGRMTPGRDDQGRRTCLVTLDFTDSFSKVRASMRSSSTVVALPQLT